MYINIDEFNPLYHNYFLLYLAHNSQGTYYLIKGKERETFLKSALK